MSEERKCLECGTEIIGRIDKKFCSDQCRNTFNNRVHAISNTYIRKVNYSLRKNRRIMEELLEKTEKDARRVHKSKLTDKGFSFDYYTNIYKTKTNKYYYFSYEYGFMKLDDDYYTVVKREEYLNKN
ncbi:MAG: hypothetical protein KAG64_00525 [Bacteroidales bacterium]|nr:hypothetical protein [Bacteroidales bacterium]